MGGNAASPFYQVSRSLLHPLEVFVTRTRENGLSDASACVSDRSLRGPARLVAETLRTLLDNCGPNESSLPQARSGPPVENLESIDTYGLHGCSSRAAEPV